MGRQEKPFPRLHEVHRKDSSGKTRKIYSQLQTAYQRLLASSWISQEKKEELRSQHEALDIMDVHETIQTHLDALYQIQKKKG